MFVHVACSVFAFSNACTVSLILRRSGGLGVSSPRSPMVVSWSCPAGYTPVGSSTRSCSTAGASCFRLLMIVSYYSTCAGAGVWSGSPFSCALLAPTFPAANFSIPEGSIAGAVVGTLNASTVSSLLVTFAIAGGNTGNAFALDACSGALTVATPSMLVFASNPIFSLVINALTNNDNSAMTVGVVTVSLTKVAKPPVLITTAVSIFVNSTIGMAAFPAITAFDDSGAATSFAVTSSSGTTFTIQSTGNNSAVLVLAASGTSLRLSLVGEATRTRPHVVNARWLQEPSTTGRCQLW